MLEALYKDNYSIVYGYLLSMCGDPALAEDLASEAFLKAIERIDTYDPPIPSRHMAVHHRAQSLFQ